MELAFVNLGTTEIIAIVVIALLLFGSRLPSVARSLGKSVTEFKKGVKDLKEDVNDDDEPGKLDRSESRELPGEKVEKTDDTSGKKENEKVSS